ncbi:MAG: ribose 5-phosphate isomerase B [Rickettsiales bacterium]|nr:ribose 5-phosphate isomerase B [Rickettsiales bacterium]
MPHTSETIAIASDHAGVDLKAQLIKELNALGYTPLDLGTHSTESVDYPDYAHAVAGKISSGETSRGIVICGSGIGISIAANRHTNIRAALCHSGLDARLSRKHNDANVLALGARIIGIENAKDALRNFLSTEFEGGRHKKRVDKIEP